MTEKEIKKILREYKKDTQGYFDKKTEETKRHFEVLAEGLRDEIKLVAEGVSMNAEKLKEHDQIFERIEETLQTIKLDIEFIKHELKQKISRDEFAALEKRVSLLEAKLNKMK